MTSPANELPALPTLIMNIWTVLLLLLCYLVTGFGLGWLYGRARYRAALHATAVEDLRLHIARQALELNGFRRELEDVRANGSDMPRDRVERAYASNRLYEQQLENGTQRLGEADGLSAEWKRLLERIVEYRGQVREFGGVLEQSLSQEPPDELAGALIVAVSELCQSNRALETELQEARRTIAAQQSRLEDAERDARLDPLTRLANRRAFEERLDACQSRFDREQEEYAVVLFDLDRFKSLNDRYGHRCGDAVLAVFGRILAESVRGYDHAARLGGEEFASLLPAAGLREARTVAERCRRRVEQAVVHQAGHEVRFTVSAGVAAVREGDTPAAVLERADAALYAAKTAGRNRTYVNTDSLPTEVRGEAVPTAAAPV